MISPNLTSHQDAKQGKGGGPLTNEAVGAENYGTISYMVESPHEAGVFYTGSDDGLVYLTRDNGIKWQNITPKDWERHSLIVLKSPHTIQQQSTWQPHATSSMTLPHPYIKAIIMEKLETHFQKKKNPPPRGLH